MAGGSANVRVYRRAARQRLGDAQYLLASGDDARGTGAMYLAGYAVECGLKALHLSRLPPDGQAAAMKGYRTARSHGYEWLRRQCVAVPGGNVFTQTAQDLLADLDGWETRLRYNPASTPIRDARAFVVSAEQFLTWIEEKTL